MALTDQEKEEVISSLVLQADPKNRGWYEETLRKFWDDIIAGIKVGNNLKRSFRSLEVRNELSKRNLLQKVKE